MKTREEVEDLKRDWTRDPIWEVEDTEGFEDYKTELEIYLLKWKIKWENEHLSRLIKHEEQFDPVSAAFGMEESRKNICKFTDRFFEISGLITMEYI